MPKFTTPENLYTQIDKQSVGPYTEGNELNEILRVFQPEQGIDVLYRNPLVNDDSTEIVDDMDGRIKLGTFTLNNRGFWEDINFNPSTLQPYLTSDLRKTVKTRIVPIPDNDGKMVYKDINLPNQIDRDYSIDALSFVTDPNNENEIVRVDKYYDKEVNPNEYELATEGKINYYLYPRTSGRISPDLPIDIFKSRNKKTSSGNINTFDRAAGFRIERKNEGYTSSELNTNYPLR